MELVYARVAERNREFAELPLFSFLRDSSVSPAERLEVAPYFVFFVMTFGDLNRLVLRDLGSDDVFQKMVNKHSYEDDDHWKMLLDDLKKLGYDQRAPLTDHLRFLWGSQTEKSRALGYKLCGLVYDAEPLAKLAVIEALEASGRVFFQHAAFAAASFREERGVELEFFGDVHLDRELGHVANDAQVSEELCKVELDPELRARALRGVDVCYDALADMVTEAWAFVTPPAGQAAAQRVSG